MASLDPDLFYEACQEANGCAVMLRLAHLTVDGYDVPAVTFGPVCRMHLDANRSWSVSHHCLQPYSVVYQDGQGGSRTEVFDIYKSSNHGTDGDGNDRYRTVIDMAARGPAAKGFDKQSTHLSHFGHRTAPYLGRLFPQGLADHSHPHLREFGDDGR